MSNENLYLENGEQIGNNIGDNFAEAIVEAIENDIRTIELDGQLIDDDEEGDEDDDEDDDDDDEDDDEDDENLEEDYDYPLDMDYLNLAAGGEPSVEYERSQSLYTLQTDNLNNTIMYHHQAQGSDAAQLASSTCRTVSSIESSNDNIDCNSISSLDNVEYRLPSRKRQLIHDILHSQLFMEESLISPNGYFHIQKILEEINGKAFVNKGETVGDNTKRISVLRVNIIKRMIHHLPIIKQYPLRQCISYIQLLLSLITSLQMEDSIQSEIFNYCINRIIPVMTTQENIITEEDNEYDNHLIGCWMIIRHLLNPDYKFDQAFMYKSTCENNMKTMQIRIIKVLSNDSFISHCQNFFLQYHVYFNQNNRLLNEMNSMKVKMDKPKYYEKSTNFRPFFDDSFIINDKKELIGSFKLQFLDTMITVFLKILEFKKNKIVDIVFPEHISIEFINILPQLIVIFNKTKYQEKFDKVLIYASGSVEIASIIKDQYTIKCTMDVIKQILAIEGPLSYANILSLIGLFNKLFFISSLRLMSWLKNCTFNKDSIIILFKAYLQLPIDMAPFDILSKTLVVELKGKLNSEHKRISTEIVQLIYDYDKDNSKTMINKFIDLHLLDCNSQTHRRKAQNILYKIFSLANEKMKYSICGYLWSILPQFIKHGSKSSNLFDLLGYFTLKINYLEKFPEHVNVIIKLLKQTNKELLQHPNHYIYANLSGLISMDGYYLENVPCLVCNDPELSFTTSKLFDLQLDMKSTSTNQIVKLKCSHYVSSINLKISDFKRIMMCKTIAFYYNNKNVESVLDLKNRPEEWIKVKEVSLVQAQSEVMLELPYPILARNLKIEYIDFYDYLSGTTIPCPRCSNMVQAAAGICNICNESIYQCAKCRGINYDDKCPFLCHNCGYCKYAKFEFSVSSKVCCNVDSIDNDMDRREALKTVTTLLNDTHTYYNNLEDHIPVIRKSLRIILSQESFRDLATSVGPSPAIVELSRIYSKECKEISSNINRNIQKITAFRSEISRFMSNEEQNSQTIQRNTNLQGRHSCYACTLATIKNLVQFTKCMILKPKICVIVAESDLYEEVLMNNLKRTGFEMKKSVKELVILLATDCPQFTIKLNSILTKKIIAAVRNCDSVCFDSNIKDDVTLFLSTLEINDSCWRMRLRCTVALFSLCENVSNMDVVNFILLPCIHALFSLGKRGNGSLNVSRRHVVTSNKNLFELLRLNDNFDKWKRYVNSSSTSGTTTKKIQRPKNTQDLIIEKYALRWMNYKSTKCYTFDKKSWLKKGLFTCSDAMNRKKVCLLLYNVCAHSGLDESYKLSLLDLLYSYLPELCESNSYPSEYLDLFDRVLDAPRYKYYLVRHGVIEILCNLITSQVEKIKNKEKCSLQCDLNEGASIKYLTQMLTIFMENKKICDIYKKMLMPMILDSYLVLNHTIIVRTKNTIDSGFAFLELINKLTSGSEKDMCDFMELCVRNVLEHPDNDLVSPVFLFEKIAKLIDTTNEEGDKDYMVILSKDSSQEEYLQGRMTTNPYSSSQLGITMRDIKNKICIDTEIVALLDDDNGMELLVEDKIISLNLPVEDVFHYLWCKNNSANEPMLITYRIRGLNGDATEDTIETFNNTKEEIDNETVYRLGATMAHCGGLKIILDRFARIDNLQTGKYLMEVIIKLLSFCAKLKINREILMKNSNTIEVMLNALNKSLIYEKTILSQPVIGLKKTLLTEDILSFMLSLLKQYYSNEDRISWDNTEHNEGLNVLLERVMEPEIQDNKDIFNSITKIIPYLTYGHVNKIKILVDYFLPYLQFDLNNAINENRTDAIYRQCFCEIIYNCSNCESGHLLRNYIFESNLTYDIINSLIKNSPSAESLIAEANDVWTKFCLHSYIVYIIKILHGLSLDHEATQILIGERAFNVIHYMEQLSMSNNIGGLCELLLNSFNKNEEIIEMIRLGRLSTVQERKRKSMLRRKRHLKNMGMKTNEKGQVISNDRSLLDGFIEETGLVCSICREGYNLDPEKILSIYTFTKRTTLDEFEIIGIRTTYGFTSVSHFIIVHNECHKIAVAIAKTSSRGEWTSATLHNSNTKCNALLPIWSGKISEGEYVIAMNKYHRNLGDVINRNEITYINSIHSLRIIIQRMSLGLSLSDDCGGGAATSNLNTIPYWIMACIYQLKSNSDEVITIEAERIDESLEYTTSQILASAHHVDSMYFTMALALCVKPYNWWRDFRVDLLKKLLNVAHARHLSSSTINEFPDNKMLEFKVYKGCLIYFAIINRFFEKILKNVVVENSVLKSTLSYMNREKEFLDITEQIAEYLEYQLLKSDSFENMFILLDVDIENFNEFVKNCLNNI